ncbi:glycosyltransferase family 2 protein [Xanthobacter flavus]|uniref:glycosyltransferase family 2 protein n=1 Tax=Xanthobacter flavus TaxID=281 RepID=UPI00372A374B
MSPRLTIGLIIYNGASSVRTCIDSLLGQTYTDFELLIHDNGSTDGTSDICAEYAERDARIIHVRHPSTIAQSANFRGVLMAARTELFMWAADDDVWGPRFAELCIAELDRNPEAVACCTKVMFRYPDGAERPARGTFPISGTAEQRISTYLRNPRDSARLYSVYRTAGLQSSYPADINMFAYDWLVVCLSMVQGDHIEVDDFQLLRSGQEGGKYFAKYDRHFVRAKGLLGSLSYMLPLLPLTWALKQYLSPSCWRAARWRLLRLNIQQFLLLLRWKYPITESLFVAIRRIDRMAGNS